MPMSGVVVLAALLVQNSPTPFQPPAPTSEIEAARAIEMARGPNVPPIGVGSGAVVYDYRGLLAMRAKAELAAGRPVTPSGLLQLVGREPVTVLIIEPTPCEGGRKRATAALLRHGPDRALRLRAILSYSDVPPAIRVAGADTFVFKGPHSLSGAELEVEYLCDSPAQSTTRERYPFKSAGQWPLLTSKF